ncbi:hypothetical protein GCM10017688_23010 [Streptomyces ramulosus]
MLFASWGELREYAEYDPAGRDLLPLVELVDTHGSGAVLATLDQLSPEEHAEVTVSTAHRAKGREWDSVRIGDDSRSPMIWTSTTTAGYRSPAPSIPTRPASPT